MKGWNSKDHPSTGAIAPCNVAILDANKHSDVIDPDLYDSEFALLGTDGVRGWLVSYPDLPGCFAHGRTKAEAFENGSEAVRLWVKACHERGIPVPPPNAAKVPSGHIRVRVPRTLQKRLVVLARQTDTSVNTFVVNLVQEGLDLLDASKVDAASGCLTLEAMSRALRSISSEPNLLVSLVTWDGLKDHDSFPGEWGQRLEPYLHHQLRFRAEEQGVSINALIACLIALGVGRREGALLALRSDATQNHSKEARPSKRKAA